MLPDASEIGNQGETDVGKRPLQGTQPNRLKVGVWPGGDCRSPHAADGRFLTYSVEKLVFVAATTLPPNTHPIDNWYYAGTQAKQQPPGPDIIESCYPLGSSQSRAASRDEKFRPTPRWEFFNRIDPLLPVAISKTCHSDCG